jgi:hypothetical protein
MIPTDGLHRLVDAQPSAARPEAKRILEDLLATQAGPRSLEEYLAGLPEDDEPPTPEEERLLQEGLDDLAAGRAVADAQAAAWIRRRLGEAG